LLDKLSSSSHVYCLIKKMYVAIGYLISEKIKWNAIDKQ
jgi:hypothetical protein